MPLTGKFEKVKMLISAWKLKMLSHAIQPLLKGGLEEQRRLGTVQLENAK